MEAIHSILKKYPNVEVDGGLHGEYKQIQKRVSIKDKIEEKKAIISEEKDGDLRKNKSRSNREL